MDIKSLLEKINESPNFVKTRFVLTIGDDGAILTYVRNNKLISRLFVRLSSESDMQNLQNTLANDHTATIYLLIDVVDQSYSQHLFPPISYFNLQKIVSKRLEREHQGENMLKGYIPLGKAGNGRNDLAFLFVSCALTSPVIDWLNYVIKLPNSLAGIYLLPVEMQALMKKINKSIFVDNIVKKSEWQLFVTHNKCGGFRQVAFKNEKIVFTRMINHSSEQTSDVIAGNIEQDILGSIEYLKRSSLKEEDLDLFIIASASIKKSLSSSKLPGKNVFLLTPFELANKLPIIASASPEDRFADVVLSTNFLTQKNVLKLHTPETKNLLFLNIIAKWLPISSISLLLFISIFIINLQLQILDTKSDIGLLTQQRDQTQQRLLNIQKNNPGEEEGEKIKDQVNLYQKMVFTNQDLSVFKIISDFASIKGFDAIVKSINWSLTDRNSVQNNANNNTNTNDKLVVVKISIDFRNTSGSYQELFNNFDLFSKRLELKFNTLNVEYSKLTDKISFNTSNKLIPLQITLSGPKIEKK